MTRRLFPAILLFLLMLPSAAWVASAQGTVNLLVNPGFENGYYHANNVPELAVPNGWQIHYIDGQPFEDIAEGTVARRPETVVWYIENAPLSERSLFFLDGNYTLKIFKPWAPLYAALSQDVTGLQVGTEYEFVANVFVDVVETYSSTGKIPPSNEPDGVRLRTGFSRTGADWRDASKIEYSSWTTAGNTSKFHQNFVTLRQKFTATRSSMTVWVEMVSRYGYVNNGFFLDHMELLGPRSGQTNTQPTTQPTVAGPSATPAPPTAVPPTAPPPTATPQPQPTAVRYVVQRGDTLGALARRFGVSLAALASANRIVDYNRIYVGQVLTIPTAGGAPPPAATTVPQNPQTPPTVAPTVATGGQGGTYVVQRGDQLGLIARRFGVTVAALAAANRIVNTNQIYVGQVLVIPGGAAPAARLYTVQTGDTLAKIAARFGTTVAALQAANNLSNINFIYTGQVLRIP